MFSRFKRKRRIKEFCNYLGSYSDVTKLLSVITVASVDPKLASNKKDMIYASLSTVLDTIAFATFTNRFMVLTKVSKAYIASIFTSEYIKYTKDLTAYALSVDKNAVSNFLDNRLALFEDAYLNYTNSRSASMLDLFTKLLVADCYSDSLSLYDTVDQFPLSLDLYSFTRAKISVSAYFDAFSTYFDPFITETQTYLTTHYG